MSARSAMPIKLRAMAGRLHAWAPSRKQFALFWAAAIGLIALSYLPTLTISPPVWRDEAHIVEYGRLFFDPDPQWSIFWVDDGPIVPWYYIGGVIQELASRASAPSVFGSRLTALLGALFAASTLAAWLLRRGVVPAAAFFLGLLFLLDPTYVASYRGGRVDGFAIGLACTALYLIRSAELPRRVGQLFVAAALLAIAFFVWPSVAFLTPLVALELSHVARSGGRIDWRVAPALAVGAVAGLVCAALPIVLRVPGVLEDVPKQLFAAGISRRAAAAGPGLEHKFVELCFPLFVRAPWNGPLCVLLWKRARSHVVLLLGALPVALMFATMLYSNRVIYVVFYLVVFYSEAFHGPVAASPAKPPTPWVALSAALLGAVGSSVVLRSAIAWNERDARSESHLIAAGRDVDASAGPVCLEAIELYFVGRQLGWQMFTEPKSLPRCQIAVTPQPTPELAAALAAQGFRKERMLLEPRASAQPSDARSSFGPFIVYRRVPQ